MNNVLIRGKVHIRFLLSTLLYSTTCKMRAQQGSSQQCLNTSCPSHSSSFATEAQFSLPLALADHTGGLEGVRLSGKAASDLLKLTVSHPSHGVVGMGGFPLYFSHCVLQPAEFLDSTDPEDRMALKLRLQLERFKIYFKVQTNLYRTHLSISALHTPWHTQ